MTGAIQLHVASCRFITCCLLSHLQVGGDSFDSPKRSSQGKEAAQRRPVITASSATLELDELMQNLEDFVPPAPAPSTNNPAPQKPKSAMEDLNNMMSSLETDMETVHGVSTVAKGMCAACKKPILDKVLDALGRQWHPAHFTCAVCEVELGNSTYYESNGRPYCEKDFHELYAPRCAYCNGPILDVSQPFPPVTPLAVGSRRQEGGVLNCSASTYAVMEQSPVAIVA